MRKLGFETGQRSVLSDRAGANEQVLRKTLNRGNQFLRNHHQPRRQPVMLNYLLKLLMLTMLSSMASAVWPNCASKLSPR